MGKGRDKRRRKTRGKEEVRAPKGEPLSGEPFGPFDPYAAVFAPLKPKPTLRSGAIALPDPEEHEHFLPEAIGVMTHNCRCEGATEGGSLLR
jgi:hypothetical protein